MNICDVLKKARNIFAIRNFDYIHSYKQKRNLSHAKNYCYFYEVKKEINYNHAFDRFSKLYFKNAIHLRNVQKLKIYVLLLFLTQIIVNDLIQ